MRQRSAAQTARGARMKSWFSVLNDRLPMRYAAWFACGVGFAIGLGVVLPLDHRPLWLEPMLHNCFASFTVPSMDLL